MQRRPSRSCARDFRWTPSPVGGSYIKFEVTPDNRVTGMYHGPGGGRG